MKSRSCVWYDTSSTSRLPHLGQGSVGSPFAIFPFLSVGVILVYANVVIKSSERGGGICFSMFAFGVLRVAGFWVFTVLGFTVLPHTKPDPFGSGLRGLDGFVADCSVGTGLVVFLNHFSCVVHYGEIRTVPITEQFFLVNCSGDECVGLLKDFYVFHFCLSTIR